MMFKVQDVVLEALFSTRTGQMFVLELILRFFCLCLEP